jgi:hypothetical protein
VNSAQHHQEDQKDLHGLNVCPMDDLCIDLNQKIAAAGRLRGELEKPEQDGEGCDAVLAGLTNARCSFPSHRQKSAL